MKNHVDSRDESLSFVNLLFKQYIAGGSIFFGKKCLQLVHLIH